MIDYIFLTGIIGSLVLVLGAAWPENMTSSPTKSIKNWLFAIGALLMLSYATFGYMTGGAIFYIFLQAFIVIASVLMMLKIDDRIDTAVVSIFGIGFIIWSLMLFEGYSTIIFIIGLSGIGLGYAFDMGTLRRGVALTFGSALIALFSYIGANWIFFWLNVFFALFSGYYMLKTLIKSSKPARLGERNSK